MGRERRSRAWGSVDGRHQWERGKPVQFAVARGAEGPLVRGDDAPPARRRQHGMAIYAQFEEAGDTRYAPAKIPNGQLADRGPGEDGFIDRHLAVFAAFGLAQVHSAAGRIDLPHLQAAGLRMRSPQ